MALDGSTVQVFVVDDHRVVRTGLAGYLSVEPGTAVIGEAADGQQALDRIAALCAAGRPPDVVLMDLLMPVLDGIATTAEIKRRWPDIEVVAMTSFLEEAKVRAALEAGAAGYVLKDADPDDVLHAVRAAVAGRVLLDRAAAGASAVTLRTSSPAGPALTSREREVVTLLARGGTNRQIAAWLGVTERTARTYVSNILAELALASRTQLARWAVREGLVDAATLPRPRGVVASAGR
jgi:DNA-binding NarL/FixJ family response regulator